MDPFAIGPFSSLFVVALRKTLGFEAGNFGQDSELRRVDSVRPCVRALSPSCDLLFAPSLHHHNVMESSTRLSMHHVHTLVRGIA